MKRLFLAVAVAIVAASWCRADCGDEAWVVPPNEIEPAVLSKVTAVMTLSVRNSSYTHLTVYDIKAGTFTVLAKISLEKVKGVSKAPTCQPNANPLDGLRLPVIETQGPFVRAVLNAKYGSSTWIRPDEFGSQYTINVSSFPPGTFIRTDLLQRPEGHSVFQNPSVEEPHTILPKDYLLLKVLRQVDNFILVGLPEGEGGVKTIGWIRVRDEQGVLTVWPWYYDEC